MDLRVIGCHGGESPKHRASGFLLRDGVRAIAIDAGSLTAGLTLQEQCALRCVLVSHAHLDHIKDLAGLTDNRAQGDATEPLVIASTAPTIELLKRHFFNGLLWPDFSRLPSAERPTIVYRALEPDVAIELEGFSVTAVPVTHTIDTCGFIVRSTQGQGTLAYSGDTGPTERLWKALNDEGDALRALLLEVSFPNTEQSLADVSGHLTPQTVATELAKLTRRRDIPTFLYHLKPVFVRAVERDLRQIRGVGDLSVLRIGDELVI